MATATPARIRRCNRETEFAIAQSPAVLAARPDAKPAGSDSFTIDSFFDNTGHAQSMLTEKFNFISANRRSEAAESAAPLRIGVDVSLSPILPVARMTDTSRNLNSLMLIKGLSVDLDSDRNSIEAVG